MDFSALFRIIESTGPLGSLLIAFVLALGLVFLVLARGSSLFAAGRAEQQATDFQEKLIKAIEALTSSETSLRGQVQSLLQENAALRESLRELTSSVDLLRSQMRTMIGQMRAVRDGDMPPTDLRLPDEAA